jgi:RNA polymerase II elongation factor ELL
MPGSSPDPKRKSKPGKVTYVQPKVNTTWLKSMGVKFNPAKVAPKNTKVAPKTSTPNATTAASETAGADAALAALQNSLAEENAKKQENT